jgi:dTDP-4-dehydrorhamnose 3,5-epimerase|tara:strand:- start:517 stop:1053 length:537 start_codon:yes stop_codon:yes gene_type:complete
LKVTPLKFADVKLIEPQVFEDDRGYFFEIFNQKKFNELVDRDVHFVQDNQSKSKRGVIRGMHYQKKPFAQGKLVHVICGEIFDVVVDIRPSSATFCEHLSCILSADNKKQLWVPEGFAHGFQALSDQTIVAYKATSFYKKEYEASLSFDDPNLNIKWPLKQTFISRKDLNALSIEHLE